MDTRYSADELLSFLRYGARKGLLNPKTAKNRRVAALRIFSVLDEEEKLDLRNVDLESAFLRLADRSGRGVAPRSLATYQSRMRAALDDFVLHLENPSTLRQSTAPHSDPKKSVASKATNVPAKRSNARKNDRNNSPSLAMRSAPGIVVPVPLRSNLVVQIRDLPSDLTFAEADRIAAVLKALVVPTD